MGLTLEQISGGKPLTPVKPVGLSLEQISGGKPLTPGEATSSLGMATAANENFMKSQTIPGSPATPGTPIQEESKTVQSRSPLDIVRGLFGKAKQVKEEIVVGVGKGLGQTAKGLADLGEGIASQTVGRVGNLVAGKGFQPVERDIYEGFGGEEKVEEKLEAKTPWESVGKLGEQVAEFAIPATKISKLTKGMNWLKKTVPRVLASGTVATVQEGEVGTETGVASGLESLAPVLGAGGRVVGRLVKSLGAGMSGAPAKTLEAIVREPGLSKEFAKEVDTKGTMEIIKKNAGQIIEGVSKVRQEARKAYGDAIATLKETDINPKVFRDSVNVVLDKFGSLVRGGERKLTNVEFDNPRDLKRASALIDKLSKVDLNGLSLNRLYNTIEDMKYKTTGSDANRLAFNAFLRDMADSVRGAVKSSTTKLDEINKAYSKDLQLTEAVEGIFGGVEYKNLDELRKVSKGLESLFNKKGMEPQIIDDFLTRIGVAPSEFRAGEAVRQISDIDVKANQMGWGLGEILRAVTSSVVPPKLVRDLAIKIGKTEQEIVPYLKSLEPTVRASVIKSALNLVSEPEND